MEQNNFGCIFPADNAIADSIKAQCLWQSSSWTLPCRSPAFSYGSLWPISRLPGSLRTTDGFLISEQLRLMRPLSVQDPLHVSYGNEKILKFSRTNRSNEANLQKIMGLFLKIPGSPSSSPSSLIGWISRREAATALSRSSVLPGFWPRCTPMEPWKRRPVKAYCFNEKACLTAFSDSRNYCLSRRPCPVPGKGSWFFIQIKRKILNVIAGFTDTTVPVPRILWADYFI